MTLARKGTVLIVGAGASVPFGLPTGLGLISDIQKKLESEINDLKEAVSLGKSINEFPYSLALLSLNLEAWTDIGTKYETLQEILDVLKDATSDTIDDLIRLYPKFSTQLKKCVAFEILEKTHKRNDRGFYEVEEFHEREFPKTKEEMEEADKWFGWTKKRNWVHQFINIVRNEYLDKELRPTDKVKIISFNYDGILEAILKKKWQGEDFGLPSWNDIFEIAHPHGILPIDDILNFEELPKYLDAASKKIVVVKEPLEDNPEIIRDREKAWNWIGQADDIKSIGFAFAKSNCNLIGLESKWAEHKKRLSYINYENSYGLRERVSRFQGHRDLGQKDEFGKVIVSDNIIERALSADKNLEIHEAIMAGFLGEMPS